MSLNGDESTDVKRMKVLILEDDFVCRVTLQKLLSVHGECHVAAQGVEALQAFQMALHEGSPYDLVCLDIMMPGLDGHEVLVAMRAIEAKKGIFSGHGTMIVMVTAVGEMKHVMDAYSALCDGYVTKPVSPDTLYQTLRELKLIGFQSAGAA
jgi:two-component system chemotaxis response regulator CheY